MRRGCAAVVLAFVVTAVLASCTYADNRYGARLNADGSVDHVVCGGDGEVHVDYILPREKEQVVEWDPRNANGDPLEAGGVLYYGQAIAGQPTRASAPPERWTRVDLTIGEFARADLEVGVWVWETEFYPFLPDRPCGEWAYLENR